MIAFWDIARCSLVVVDQNFRDAYCLHHQGDEGVRTSETSFYYNETTRRNILEGYHLRAHHRENLKSHIRCRP
jgi:hypothetical protein